MIRKSVRESPSLPSLKLAFERHDRDHQVVFGRVIDGDGRPVPQARIEIWQCDSHGRYHNVDDRSSRPLDPNFQGYGTTSSGDDGGYRFRTIRPIAYPGRTPHVHFAISPPGGGRFVTQLYVAGERAKERDPVLNEIRDPAACLPYHSP